MTTDQPEPRYPIEAEIDDDDGPANWQGTDHWPFKRQKNDQLIILRKSGSQRGGWVRSCVAATDDEAVLLTLLLNKALTGEFAEDQA